MTTDTLDAPIIGERVDPLDWKDIIKTGRDAVEHMDIGRWIIGDLGTMVQAKYGQDEFGQFADEINIHRRSAEDYRAVARYYPKETRDPRHNYSMHKTAMRLNDLEASIALLNEAVGKLWSVRDLLEQTRLIKGESKPEMPLPRLTPDIIALAHAYMDKRNRDPYESRDDTNEAGHAALWALIQLVAPGYDVPGWVK